MAERGLAPHAPSSPSREGHGKENQLQQQKGLVQALFQRPIFRPGKDGNIMSLEDSLPWKLKQMCSALKGHQFETQAERDEQSCSSETNYIRVSCSRKCLLLESPILIQCLASGSTHFNSGWPSR